MGCTMEARYLQIERIPWTPALAARVESPSISLLLCLFMLVTILSGCTINAPSQHILMVNGLGNPIDPSPNFFGKHLSYVPFVTYEQMSEAQFTHHLDEMMTGLIAKAPDANGKRKVLIFVHGGLNAAKDSIARAERLRGPFEKAGYFPVFVNWESSFPTSYFDHLFNIRQGRRTFNWCCGNPGIPQAVQSGVGAVVGMLTMPFYLATDLARGILRAPVVWYALLRKADRASAISQATTADSTKQPHQTGEAQGTVSAEHAGAIAISQGADERQGFERAVTVIDDANPLKLLASVIIDAGGTGAWDNMIRRTRTLFQRDADFESSNQPPIPSGSLTRFLDHLKNTISENGGAASWDITLVGHSMGAIILNEIVRDLPQLPVSTIVYLAAACTIRDYHDTIFPYLSTRNRTAQVYHLTLHPEAEVEERSFGSVAPDGSLLVWVDKFLSNPSTALDLTAGRFTNLVATSQYTPPEIRERLHIRAFGVGNRLASHPQTHGAFSDKEFWSCESHGTLMEIVSKEPCKR